jgi:hypothetical protein
MHQVWLDLRQLASYQKGIGPEKARLPDSRQNSDYVKGHAASLKAEIPLQTPAQDHDMQF